MNPKNATVAFLLAFCCVPLFAQGWSVGASTGPFIFGKFAERTQRAGTEDSRVVLKTSLSAATRAGLSLDLQRSFNDRFSIRFGGDYTQAPLSVKTKNGTSSGVPLDAGKLRVTTFMIPLVMELNPHGTFRVHVLAGPAYANYQIRRADNQPITTPLFSDTRGRAGAVGGAGLAWWWSHDFAVEGEVLDIVTTSPIEAGEFGATGATGTSAKIPRTQNFHTTIGIRYRF